MKITANKTRNKRKIMSSRDLKYKRKINASVDKSYDPYMFSEGCYSKQNFAECIDHCAGDLNTQILNTLIDEIGISQAEADDCFCVYVNPTRDTIELSVQFICNFTDEELDIIYESASRFSLYYDINAHQEWIPSKDEIFIILSCEAVSKKS